MSEEPEDLKNLMPTERKSIWRTVEERRMSDLTRVLEWLERRQGKKKRAFQKQKAREELGSKANEKSGKKGEATRKRPEKDGRKVTFGKKQDLNATKKHDQSKLYGMDTKGMQILTSSFSRDLLKKAGAPGSRRGSENTDLDIKDALALESNTRPSTFRRQSTTDPMFQDMFTGRRVGLLRDWSSKVQDSTYERKLKSLMEKGTEPKIETVKMLKPEEVLSCRYLRLSKNNIKTLIKLCKDAGLNVDIHPHMVESEIDSKKVFNRHASISL